MKILSFATTAAILSAVMMNAISAQPSTLTSAICSIITALGSMIALLALLLFVLGAVLYAVAHFLPAAGNLRAGMQGWAMGMLVAGILALTLYLLAPRIITLIINVGGTSSFSNIPQPKLSC